MFASEQILKVAHHAVELHGGNGMMRDFGVEKLLRDAAIFPHGRHRRHLQFKIVRAMFRTRQANTPGRIVTARRALWLSR
jgi:alkylation response protein AidB-like acyl-CoA dehydrogenase